MRFFILMASCALWPGLASAQSWCSAANLNPTEATICSDDILRQLDVEMATLAHDIGPVIRNDQRAWLRDDRNACGTSLLCIEQSYVDRIAYLRAYEPVSEAPAYTLTGQPRPWCRSSGLNAAERTICTNDTLSDLDAALEAVYGAARADPSDQSQIDWLADRNSCGSDAQCLSASYLRRIIWLGGRIRGH